MTPARGDEAGGLAGGHRAPRGGGLFKRWAGLGTSEGRHPPLMTFLERATQPLSQTLTSPQGLTGRLRKSLG